MSSHIHTIVDPDPRAISATRGDFVAALAGPTEFRLSGRDPSRYRVAVVLLHGDEPSGVEAARRWLRAGRAPAVDTSLFVMAVEAARQPPGFAHRMLPGRRDLNRCFFGPFDDHDGALAQALYRRVCHRPCEALVDLHNNSGHNPAYGISTHATAANMKLIELFSHTACLLQELALGTLLEVIDNAFPAISIECGQTGTDAADDTASAGLDAFLSRDQLELDRPPDNLPAHMTILEQPVRVCVSPGARLEFADAPVVDADLTLVAHLEQHNFRALAPGALLGWLTPQRSATEAVPSDTGHDPPLWPLSARDARGRDITRECFFVEGSTLRWRGDRVPIMMSTVPGVVFADCLCYLMRRYSDPRPAAAAASPKAKIRPR
ncbi:MAG: hypothetical protein Tsb0020_11160 [Haliangiales bacterium]